MTEPLFREDSYLRSCDATVVAVEPNGVVLDRTVFYPTGGGQPGDSGTFSTADGRKVTIAEARKGAEPGTVVHIPAPDMPALHVGDKVTAAIDWERRHRLMRMHTLLHLLSAAVPFPVTGGQVSDGKGRLDFDVPNSEEGVSLDKATIERALNDYVAQGKGVSVRWITDDELAAQPQLVKTMSVKPPVGTGRVRLLEVDGIDLQPCGGTHVRSIEEIGPVKVDKIESKGAKNRRVVVSFA
ncbi:alanyl-tRNA editing protein [Roseiterribacter gracilis]|uniref:Alanine--tRNA ligase n=1 Tax=Roseiterribacter gracilis TaxID=2812848 RepID=A0A8S8X787_9PROT|nr:serine-tRNA(Ala) deacylase AlaX [Rhodospirillales bacterium TMPK1]